MVLLTSILQKKWRSSFYVSDILKGAATFQEAIAPYRAFNSIMNDSDIKVQKWASNGEYVQQLIDQAKTDVIPADRNIRLYTSLQGAWDDVGQRQ